MKILPSMQRVKMSETDRLWLLYQSGLPSPDDLFPSFGRKLRIDIFGELSIILFNHKTLLVI